MEGKTTKAPGKKQGIGVKNAFITGLIIITPLYITWLLLRLVAGWIRSTLHAAFHAVFSLVFGAAMGEFYDKHETVFLFVLGAPIVFGALVFIGWAAKNWVGKRVLAWGEARFKRIPIIGGIYSGARQFVDTVVVKGKESYKRVVMVEFPRRGCWVVGFVTTEDVRFLRSGGKEADMGEGEGKLMSIFVPTTPNPTSGYLFFFRESEVLPLDITVEEGLKLVVSGGVLQPALGQPPPAAVER